MSKLLILAFVSLFWTFSWDGCPISLCFSLLRLQWNKPQIAVSLFSIKIILCRREKQLKNSFPFQERVVCGVLMKRFFSLQFPAIEPIIASKVCIEKRLHTREAKTILLSAGQVQLCCCAIRLLTSSFVCFRGLLKYGALVKCKHFVIDDAFNPTRERESSSQFDRQLINHSKADSTCTEGKFRLIEILNFSTHNFHLLSLPCRLNVLSHVIGMPCMNLEHWTHEKVRNSATRSD